MYLYVICARLSAVPLCFRVCRWKMHVLRWTCIARTRASGRALSPPVVGPLRCLLIRSRDAILEWVHVTNMYSQNCATHLVFVHLVLLGRLYFTDSCNASPRRYFTCRYQPLTEDNRLPIAAENIAVNIRCNMHSFLHIASGFCTHDRAANDVDDLSLHKIG